MTEIVVRPFRSEDRPVIRSLCHRLGYMGDSAASYWRHHESFAEVWTAYYTDFEPESLFVAEGDGELFGYLTGCVDSRSAPSPAQAIARQALRFGLFLRPGSAGFLWRGLLDSVWARGAPSGELDDPRWPAHLHINLLPAARGRGVGAALMRAWFARLQKLGSPGCHLGTLAENQRGIGFFESQGFRRLGPPQLAPGMRSPDGGRHHLQFMVRDMLQDGGSVGDGRGLRRVSSTKYLRSVGPSRSQAAPRRETRDGRGISIATK